MSYEQLDRSIDADSDSDDELAEQAHMYRMATMKGKEGQGDAPSPTSAQPPDLANLSLESAPKPSAPKSAAPPRPPPMTKPAQPPRPAPPQQSAPEDDEDDDPFADRNVIETPQLESSEPRWS
jgi:hypothetical protein